MSFVCALENGAFIHEPREDRANELAFEVRGNLAPFVEVILRNGEGLVVDKQSILQHDFGLTVRPWPGLDDSRWLVVNASHEDELGVMLTSREPGFAGAFDLNDYAGKLICPSTSLLANGPGVQAGYYAKFKRLGITLVLLEGNGWAFLASRGDVFEYQLKAGEKVCVRAHSVAAMAATVDFDPSHPICKMQDPDGKMQFALLTGPGKIWLQSVHNTPPPTKRQKKQLGIVSSLPQVQEMQLGELALRPSSSA